MSSYILYRSKRLWLEYPKNYFIGCWPTLSNCPTSCRKLSLGLWPWNLGHILIPLAALVCKCLGQWLNELVIEHLLCIRKYSRHRGLSSAKTYVQTSVLMQPIFCTGGTENKRFWAEFTWSGNFFFLINSKRVRKEMIYGIRRENQKHEVNGRFKIPGTLETLGSNLSLPVCVVGLGQAP